MTNSYEEFIHANFRTKAEIEAKGFNNFLIEVLYGVDVALADYASANISLLDRYSDLNGLVLENWDNYLDTLNREKIKDVEVDVITYMGNNHLPDYYFGFLPYIISRTPHEAIFRKYGDIDLSYMREPKEFAERRFCETFISRITKRFNKDTLFGEEDYDNGEKCEIIDIAKVRDNK